MAGMEIDIRLTIGPVGEALGRLQRKAGFNRGARAALLHLQSVVNVYPRHVSRPQPFENDKQRRGFFAKLNAGEIEVPYVRGLSPSSERLGQRWRTESMAVGAKLTNNASYAGLVVGRSQTRYHQRTGWKTIEDAIREEGDVMFGIVKREVRRDL